MCGRVNGESLKLLMQRGPMGEEQHAIPYLRELVVFLAATGLIVPALRRARLNMVLGYLIIGGVIGPFGLGLFADDFTWLQYVVISLLVIHTATQEVTHVWCLPYRQVQVGQVTALLKLLRAYYFLFLFILLLLLGV